MPTLQQDGSVSYRMREDSIYVNLQQHPLGTMSNENFSVPANYRIPPARIYVINHSRTRQWRRLIQAVSYRQGAEDALLLNKELKNLYTVEMLYKQVEKGRDMNQYTKLEVKPVVWDLKLPGGKSMLIPPSHEDTPDRPIMVEIPDGTWDLYLGNYNRMQGFSGLKPIEEDKFDQRVKQNEELQLAIRWRNRHNPVFGYIDDNKRFEKKGPDVAFAVLEFVRIPNRPTAEPIDKDYLSALDLFEAN